MSSEPSNSPRLRTGRRPGPSTTRAEILAAARGSFAQLGYDRTSVRGIAARAGVDPALVHRFFGSKDDLLAAALSVAMHPGESIPEVMEGDRNTIGERLVRYFLSVWEEPHSRDVLVGMLRSATTNEHAAELLRTFIGREVYGRVAEQLDDEDAQLRATLAGSQLIGLGLLRYIVGIEPVASASPETLVAAYGPTLQRYLTGELDLPAKPRGSRRMRGER
jgi:AcrR family transcriptional regulator